MLKCLAFPMRQGAVSMDHKSANKQRVISAIARGTAVGVVLTAVFAAGFLIRGRSSVTAQEKPDQPFTLLAEVQTLLESNYLRELPPAREMEYAAIRGYLGQLNDPYTFFNDPPVTQSESDVLAGQYGGVGVQVKLNDRGQFVLYPFRDGPAAQAGIQDGDILVAVDGTPLSPNERLDVVDQMLRGEVGEGRGVTLTVLKPGTGESEEYFIEFAIVAIPSVIWRPVTEEPQFGYIQIRQFTSRTPDELRTALEELKSQGVTAWILDLRSNSGGLLQESVEVASEFLDGGVVFYERRRDGEFETEATQGGSGLDKPLVVLVNSGTASAAELVAGAIRDQGRGILIGQRTYGKGSVQLIFRLSDGSSVHITSAEWFTPAKTPLAGNGLEPNIITVPADDGRDVELAEAVRYLRGVIDAAN